MYQISKLSVLRGLTGTIRYSASKCGSKGSSKDGKGDSKKGAPGKCGPKDGKGDSKKAAPPSKCGPKDGKGDSNKCAPTSKSGSAGSAKDGKSEAKCAPLKKLDLCEAKKGGKDAKANRCGAVPPPPPEPKKPETLGGVGRESSCKPKKKPPTKGTSTAGTFRKICLFGVIPAIVLLNILIFATRTHPEREEFKKWPHMYKRDKPFPWGDGIKSFFHNPHTNALPEIGYEDE